MKNKILDFAGALAAAFLFIVVPVLIIFVI